VGGFSGEERNFVMAISSDLVTSKNIRYPKYLGNTVVSDKKTRTQNTIGHSRFSGRPGFQIVTLSTVQWRTILRRISVHFLALKMG